jgi:hypothetical protein
MSNRALWDRRRALITPALLLVILALLAVSRTHRGQSSVAGPGAPGKPAPAVTVLGVNVNRLFNDATFSAAEIAAQLQLVRTTGVTVARSDALWDATETVAPTVLGHRYDWSFDDQIANSLAVQGLRWLPIIDYSPSWARALPAREHSAPRLTSAYAAFAGALALRYGAGGSFWRTHPSLTPRPVDTFEIWNEPDSPSFWQPAPAPGGYAALYAAARDAILTSDPAARVIVGGLTHPATFLPAMLAARPSLRGHLDGVAIHPYASDPAAVLDAVRAARGAIDSLELGPVPLYVTEFGWTTRPAGALHYASAAARPGYIARTLPALTRSGCGVSAALLYTWITPERNPRDPEDWFGVEPPHGGPAPDVAALARGLREASAPPPHNAAC